MLLLYVGNSGSGGKGTFLNEHPRRPIAKISEGGGYGTFTSR